MTELIEAQQHQAWTVGDLSTRNRDRGALPDPGQRKIMRESRVKAKGRGAGREKLLGPIPSHL